MMERDPDLALGGFSLWVTGKSYAHAEDVYGQDILDYRATVETPWSAVRADGLLSATSLASFSQRLTAIHDTLDGDAALEAHEGDTRLVLRLAMTPLGHVKVVVDLRLGLGEEEDHRVAWSLDQTFLEPFSRQVRALSAAYPSPFPTRSSEPANRVELLKSKRVSQLLDAIFGKRADPA